MLALICLAAFTKPVAHEFVAYAVSYDMNTRNIWRLCQLEAPRKIYSNVIKREDDQDSFTLMSLATNEDGDQLLFVERCRDILGDSNMRLRHWKLKGPSKSFDLKIEGEYSHYFGFQGENPVAVRYSLDGNKFFQGAIGAGIWKDIDERLLPLETSADGKRPGYLSFAESPRWLKFGGGHPPHDEVQQVKSDDLSTTYTWAALANGSKPPEGRRLIRVWPLRDGSSLCLCWKARDDWHFFASDSFPYSGEVWRCGPKGDGWQFLFNAQNIVVNRYSDESFLLRYKYR